MCGGALFTMLLISFILVKLFPIFVSILIKLKNNLCFVWQIVDSYNKEKLSYNAKSFLTCMWKNILFFIVSFYSDYLLFGGVLNKLGNFVENPGWVNWNWCHFQKHSSFEKEIQVFYNSCIQILYDLSLRGPKTKDHYCTFIWML